MTRRLATDAKIVLERAGWIVEYTKASGNYLIASWINKHVCYLPITGGTVDNVQVEQLLEKAKKGGLAK